MVHISGRNGAVYAGELLIEDCEDTWDEQVVAGCTLSTTAGKVGTNAARVTTVGVGATTVMESEVVVKNLTAYDGVIFWARSSLSPTAGQLQLLVDDTIDCPYPCLENLDIPALTATVWKLCFVKLADPSLLAATISVGLYAVPDLADGTFDIDRVSALAEIDGIRDWTLDYTVDMLETTDFASAGTADYLPGISRWSGSFTGLKDGTPLAIGSQVYVTFGESDTVGNYWAGMVVITAARPNVAHDGLVEYAYDFQGTDVLEAPNT